MRVTSAMLGSQSRGRLTVIDKVLLEQSSGRLNRRILRHTERRKCLPSSILRLEEHPFLWDLIAELISTSWSQPTAGERVRLVAGHDTASPAPQWRCTWQPERRRRSGTPGVFSMERPRAAPRGDCRRKRR
eukprot:5639708-Prymnesium_polylepis.1